MNTYKYYVSFKKKKAELGTAVQKDCSRVQVLSEEPEVLAGHLDLSPSLGHASLLLAALL